MQDSKTELLNEVAQYYSSKLAQHGTTARGVDWNGEESQYLRFEQLSKAISLPNNFSVNDLGCGYGAFYDYLKGRYASFTYFGFDVSKDMVNAAKQRHRHCGNAHFELSGKLTQAADYGFASGVFNVRMKRSDNEWQDYIVATLDDLFSTSKLGFAFNCLTSYSDADKMRDYLYYSNPCELFDLCKRRYSRNVALLHDYGLYEFTLIVRK